MGKNSGRNSHVVKQPVLRSIARLKKLLGESKIRFEKMILFGSHAKGLATNRSDIDLCLVVGNKTDILRTRIDANSIAGRNGINADIVVTSVQDWKKDMISPLLHEIRTHGIPL